jgi:hypothetical protein
MGCAHLGQRGGAGGELPTHLFDMKNSFFKTLPL